jgi:hypothetical protein
MQDGIAINKLSVSGHFCGLTPNQKIETYYRENTLLVSNLLFPSFFSKVVGYLPS